MTLAPNDLRAGKLKVKVLLSLNQIAEAEADIDMMFREGLVDEELLTMKGNMCFDRSQWQLAKDYYLQSLALKPLNLSVQYNLSVVFRKLGEAKKSQGFLRLANQSRG